MVNLIVGCRLLIQFKSSFNLGLYKKNLIKVSKPQKRFKLTVLKKNLFSNPVMNKLEYGGAKLDLIAKPLF